MKFQPIIYTVVSTALAASTVQALPNESQSPPPSLYAPLAPGWRVAGPCMVLNDASNLSGVQGDIVYNTPEACTTYCSTAPTNYPPQYTYAAVGGAPWGCFCGFDSDYNQVLARRAFDYECDTPCAGDPNLACGRGNRVQLYTRSPPPRARCPGGGVSSARAASIAPRVYSKGIDFSACRTIRPSIVRLYARVKRILRMGRARSIPGPELRMGTSAIAARVGRAGLIQSLRYSCRSCHLRLTTPLLALRTSVLRS